MATRAELELVANLQGNAATKMDDLSDKGKGLGGVFGKVAGGLTSLISPVGLATAGIGLLGGALTGAISAASEEAVGIERLNTTLKNSIPGWDGNTEAIDAYIAQQETLSFADDQLRDSLGFLVGQTQNLGEAQALQATAMDLARAKGISLEAATRAVGKVDQESIGILKKLGIQVTENMTKEEALTAIRQASAGQAEAYANTAAGSMERIQNMLGNVVEDIGGVLLPIVTSGLQILLGLADGVMNFLGPAFAAVGDAIGGVVGWFQQMTEGTSSLSGGLFNIAESAANFFEPLGYYIGYVANIVAALEEFWSNLQGGMPFLEALGELGSDVFTSLQDFGRRMVDWFINDGLPGLISTLQQWGAALINWIAKDALPFIGQKLTEFGTAVGAWVTGGGLQALISNLITWGGAFLGFIAKDVLPFIVGKLGDLLSAIGTWITQGGLAALVANLVTWGTAFLGWIAKDVLPTIATKLGEFGTAVWTWITQTALPEAVKKLKEFAQAFLDWVKNDVLPTIGTKLAEFGTAIWNWITQAAKDAGDKVKALGGALVDGIKAGINAAWQGFLNWLNGILAGLPQVIKDFFGIKSPSTLMAGYGMDIGMGLAEGIKASIPLVQGAMSDLTRGANRGIGIPAGGGMGGSRMGVPGGGGIAVGSIVINAPGAPDGRQLAQSVYAELERLEQQNTRWHMRNPGWGPI